MSKSYNRWFCAHWAVMRATEVLLAEAILGYVDLRLSRDVPAKEFAELGGFLDKGEFAVLGLPTKNFLAPRIQGYKHNGRLRGVWTTRRTCWLQQILATKFKGAWTTSISPCIGSKEMQAARCQMRMHPKMLSGVPPSFHKMGESDRSENLLPCRIDNDAHLIGRDGSSLREFRPTLAEEAQPTVWPL